MKWTRSALSYARYRPREIYRNLYRRLVYLVNQLPGSAVKGGADKLYEGLRKSIPRDSYMALSANPSTMGYTLMPMTMLFCITTLSTLSFVANQVGLKRSHRNIINWLQSKTRQSGCSRLGRRPIYISWAGCYGILCPSIISSLQDIARWNVWLR
jgi:hypothetical protein